MFKKTMTVDMIYDPSIAEQLISDPLLCSKDDQSFLFCMLQLKMDRVRVSAQSTRYTHSSKNVLSPDEAELFELANLAGVTIDQNVFK